jgi:enamine deaminase RidA (YjgF/YER057c/UK114 family)
MMERTGIRVEPISTYLERRRTGRINPVVVAGGFVFVSGLPPFNEIYARYFPDDQPARIFLCVPTWPGPFDIEIDCVAVT